MIAPTRKAWQSVGFAAAALLCAAALTACSSDDSGSGTTPSGSNSAAPGGDSSGGDASGGTGGDASGKIALLLPESKTTRYEEFDRPYFEDAIKDMAPDAEVLYSNADQDSAKQVQQAQAALTNGAKVMVLDPVDSKAAATIVNQAKAQNVPVVAYDRFIEGAEIDYYVSFDNKKVGELQGQALVDKMKADGKASGSILMINGSPTDANAAQFKEGAHSVLDSSGLKILAEYDTPDWSPDKAQTWAASQVTQFASKIDGVYAANDGTAGGAIAALKAGNYTPWPPITGQDAQLAAIQSILTGDQYMTVYKAIKPEAEDAAKAAVALLKGEKPEGKTTVEGVTATLLEPVAVTKDNINDTVVKDGFYTVDQICTDQYKDACTAAGLS